MSVLLAVNGSHCMLLNRTDCIFSPDDKLVITGTSVKKGDGVGKLVFLDRQTLKTAAELDVAPESACLLLLHADFVIVLSVCCLSRCLSYTN